MTNNARPETMMERESSARANLAAALRECSQLAEAVELLSGEDLIEALVYIDSLRFVMAESGQILQGVVRGYQG